VKRLVASVCLAAFTSAASAQAPRLRVDLNCQPTEASLMFLCTVDVTDSAGRPVDGIEVTLSADMPSMPMAHNVSPVKVQPVLARPGSYQGRITLEMLGEWAVKLRFETPRPDVVVRKLDFQKDKVSPAGPR
jgi:YtkA-like